MFPGWMIIGTQDPVGNPGDFTEVVNNARAYAYADWAGICWLNDCAECEAAAPVQPGYPYVSPISDPAPWYDPANPDSAGFLGVIGLDVTGEHDSTRQTNVTAGLGGVGVVGRTYMTPRTMVLRALVIATDSCSLAFGMEWLRHQYNATSGCGGDVLTFFDCCPCVCDDPEKTSSCWADTYEQLRTDPPCSTNFWPNTYAELIAGPAADNPEWCMWVDNYRELRDGPPQWTCCTDACVVPYLRQFHNVAITEGPTVLQEPKLNSPGALAEVEFTIVAADPAVKAVSQRTASGWVNGGSPVVDPPAPPVYVNPYRQMARKDLAPSSPTTSWVRDTLPIKPIEERVLSAVEPRVRVRASQRSGPIRLGLWAGGQRVGGYTIPFIAERSSIVVNGGRAYHSTPDGYEPLSAFVRDWDGRWPQALELPHGSYELTVDQDADQAVRLFVDVLAVPVGGA